MFGFAPGGQPEGGRLGLAIREVERQSQLLIQVARRRAGTAGVTRVGQDHHRELQPLGLVDGHQLHRAARLGGRFALASADVSQGSQVFQEFGHTHQLAAMGVGQQFVDVAPQPLATRHQPQRGPVVGGIQESLEQVGHRHPPRLVVQFGHEPPRELGPAPVIFLQALHAW